MASKVKSSENKSTKTSQKQHNPLIDILKGWAILLVVLGHSVQTYTTGSFDNNLLFRIIYSFHMPLFMFLSGAAAAYSFRPTNFEFIKKKFYMLVIPFIAWYVANYYITAAHNQIVFSTYVKHLIISPDYGLWFLWVLFLIFCCLSIVKKVEQYFKIYSYLLVWLVVYSIPTNKYGIGLLKWHLPFFLAGYLIYLYRESLAKFKTVALSLSVICFPVLALTWHRVYYPGALAGLEPRLINHHLSPIAVGDVGSINTYQIVVLAYRYLVGFAGIGFTYWIFGLISNKSLNRLLGFIGLYTLDVYVSHEYFFRYSFGQSWLRITSGFIVALCLSLALGHLVLRRVPLLSTIFLGGRSKTSPLFKKTTKAA